MSKSLLYIPPQVDLAKETLIYFLSLEVCTTLHYYQLFRVNKSHSTGNTAVDGIREGILKGKQPDVSYYEGNPEHTQHMSHVKQKRAVCSFQTQSVHLCLKKNSHHIREDLTVFQ